MTIISGNDNIKYYNLTDDVPSCLWYISQKYCSIILPLHVPMEEHDTIIDDKSRREIIEFDRSISIVT